MKTKEFLELLEKNPDLSLVFKYQADNYVGTNYHITEVKHISVDSVDCGGRLDSWKETIIQLWESPSEIGKKDFMSVYKALGILRKVGRIKDYNLNSELRIEYSNEKFHTAQLYVEDFDILDRKLLVKLSTHQTDCKAQELCGVTVNPEIKELSTEPCCSPDGNCC